MTGFSVFDLPSLRFRLTAKSPATAIISTAAAACSLETENDSIKEEHRRNGGGKAKGGLSLLVITWLASFSPSSSRNGRNCPNGLATAA